MAEETRRKTLWVRSPGPWVSATGVLLERPWADRSVSPQNIIPGWEHDFPVSMPTVLSPHRRASKNLLTLRAPVSFSPAQEEGEEFEEQEFENQPRKRARLERGASPAQNFAAAPALCWRKADLRCERVSCVGSARGADLGAEALEQTEDPHR